MRGLFTKGCALMAGAKRGSAWGYEEVVEVAVGNVIADGRAVPGGVSNISTSVVAQAPDVIAMHISDLWKADAGFEAGAVNAVAVCHATGDGATDDTEALQACLDSHDEVFLPKGLYRISKTLVMKAGGSLVGLSQTHSVIAPTTGGFAASTSHPAPLLRTAAGAPVSIAFVGLVSWWHIAGAFTLEWHSKGGLWRSNYETRVCECMWLSDYGSPNAAHGKVGFWPPRNCTAGVELSVPKTQIHGTGVFYNYVSDEDVLYTDHIGYRHMLVSNNSKSSMDRLRFYAINLEHAMAEANGEFRHASHVDVYGIKKEGSTTILWIRDSVDVTVIGTAGGYSALLNASAYPDDFAPYRPAIYRVERTSPLKLAITPYPHRSVEESVGAAAQVKCSYPLDTSQLQQGNFPRVDWPALIASLWAPWCGYWATGSLVLLEADGPAKTLAAIAEPPPTLYTRGYTAVQKINKSVTPSVPLKSDDKNLGGALSLPLRVLLLTSAGLHITHALDNGFLLPAMGFSTWNHFGMLNKTSHDKSNPHGTFGAKEAMAMCDAMVSSGLRDRGYKFINLDAGWIKARLPNGSITVDRNLFPDGMAPVAKYIQSKGMEMGIYTSRGKTTCGGWDRPGSEGYEFVDAKQYAEWG
jgi:hypothetical protein